LLSGGGMLSEGDLLSEGDSLHKSAALSGYFVPVSQSTSFNGVMKGHALWQKENASHFLVRLMS
jgi:hypothetical protein